MSELFQQVLMIALGLALLGLFDEINRPARPRMKKRGGTWTQNGARGEGKIFR